jgi:hypothetical protein
MVYGTRHEALANDPASLHRRGPRDIHGLVRSEVVVPCSCCGHPGRSGLLHQRGVACASEPGRAHPAPAPAPGRLTKQRRPPGGGAANGAGGELTRLVPNEILRNSRLVQVQPPPIRRPRGDDPVVSSWWTGWVAGSGGLGFQSQPVPSDSASAASSGGISVTGPPGGSCWARGS